jgi:hypothetical protein
LANPKTQHPTTNIKILTAIGYWLLVIGYWVLVIGYWVLGIG